MAGYKRKDAVTLAFDANKKRLRAEGSIILAEVMNEALAEMDDEFQAALKEGRILEISGTRAEMKEFLRRAAVRELGIPEGARAING
jgi:hypothetical protein